MNPQLGAKVQARTRVPHGAEQRSPVHAEVLASLRRAVRPYASEPLPEWEVFAASTHYFTVDARTPVVAGDRDVFLLVRGILKLLRSSQDDAPPRIFEFIESPAMVAPRTLPHWSGTLPPLLSNHRWSQPRWSVANQDIVAAERCFLLRIDMRVVEQLMARHPAWGEVVYAMMWTYVEGTFASADFTALRGSDVETRLRYLADHRSRLLRRVSQRDIAAYLNVTESALSRVLRRLREQGVATA